MLEHLNPTLQKPNRVVVLGAYGLNQARDGGQRNALVASEQGKGSVFTLRIPGSADR